MFFFLKILIDWFFKGTSTNCSLRHAKKLINFQPVLSNMGDDWKFRKNPDNILPLCDDPEKKNLSVPVYIPVYCRFVLLSVILIKLLSEAATA